MDNKKISKPQKKTIYWVYKHDSNQYNQTSKAILDLIEKNKRRNQKYIKSLQPTSQCSSCESKLSNKETQISLINQEHNDNNGVSIVTCTNKRNYINNIFENFKRQNFRHRELIIILNSNKLNLDKWRYQYKSYDNVKIFQLDESISLGECLNYAIEKSKYDILAKFDDDDYYGENYLIQAIDMMNKTNAHVVGKSTSYVYFENKKILAVRNSGRENRFIYRVEGPTLVFKKEIFSKVRFADKNLGEDVKFCKDCCKHGFKIFSTNKENFVYVRHDRQAQHTWAINNDYYMKLCTIIGTFEDFEEYLNR